MTTAVQISTKCRELKPIMLM